MTALLVIAALALGILLGTWLAGPVASWVGRREHQGRHRTVVPESEARSWR